MFLGPLIQTAQRYCEAHPLEYIPKETKDSIVLAYSMYDNLETRSFDKELPITLSRIKSWLSDSNAIAYVEVSVSSNNIVQICSANPRSMLRAHFELVRKPNAKTCQLKVLKKHKTVVAIPMLNYFHEHSIPLEIDQNANLLGSIA